MLTPCRRILTNKKVWSILFLIGVLLSTGFIGMNAQANTANQPIGHQAQVDWVTYQKAFILKDKVLPFTFYYPKSWQIIDHKNSLDVSFQNIPQFDNPNDVKDELSNGFVKISFMIDPKADPSNLQEGETISINGFTWIKAINSSEISGDLSMTFETTYEGVVLRIYTFISGTKGNDLLLENYSAELDRMVMSLKPETTIQLERPLDAPLPPVNGK